MKIFKMAAWCLAVCALVPVAQANKVPCTANAAKECEKVDVSVEPDGAGCKATVMIDNIRLLYDPKNNGNPVDHEIVYEIKETTHSDKAKYFFDEKKGIEVTEDLDGRVKNKHRDPSDKKKFKVTVSQSLSPAYKVSYIANVMREEKSPNPPTLCEAVDPTIENR